MRRIWVSDDVWEAIAAQGKFGESEDVVLRRVFRLAHTPQEMTRPTSPPGRGKKRFAQKSMSAKVVDGVFRIRFEDGAQREWKLPPRTEKAALKQVRVEAVTFALENGATNPGQTNAVRKAFSDAGYHVTK